ncbi:MAG: hypothetical protein NZM42_03015 [Gemmatales bacterium]|nr:hypothetical protein [Gemmatales bacterium]MDW8222625.1 tetratricopeptide repeat protein [Gemmatales bacterium]
MTVFPPLLLLAIWLLVAGWPDTAQRHLRLAQAAYRRGDYASALEHYQAATPYRRDPGFVAFNQAAVLGRMQRWHDAISCYTQALEDARGRRRILSLYGRGTAYLALALHTTSAEKAGFLASAVRDLSQCLEEAPDFEDARHHLNLAQRLLQEASRTPSPDKAPSKPSQPPDNAPSPSSEGSAGTKPEQTRTGLKPVKLLPEVDAQRPLETPYHIRPGRGQLPAIPARADLPPIAPEQARHWLDVEWQRITHARAQRTGPVLGATSVRDW